MTIELKSEKDLSQLIDTIIAFTEQLGFRKTQRFKTATATSELARNILRYATEGIITISKLSENGKTGIEIVAEDKGPGIEDVELAMQDGYSTSGSLGLGLPGSKRMMDEFEIKTILGEGTKVTIRKWL